MDYTQLAAEDLIERAYSAREEFNKLYESNDLSDSVLDQMAHVVDELESLQAEADSRVALAVLTERREELARKVKSKLLLPQGPGQQVGGAGKGGVGVGFCDEDGNHMEEYAAGAEGDSSEKSIPELLNALRTAEKGSPEAKAAKAGLAAAMKKKAAGKGSDDKVAAQLDAPYKDDMTPARAKNVKVTPAVSEENAETKKVEEEASPNLRPGAKPTLSIAIGSNATTSSSNAIAIGDMEFTNVEPIKHIPTKGFGAPLPKKDTLPTDTKGKHPGAAVIKSGTVKGLKVPTPAGQVTYGEEDPVEFASATKSEGSAGNFPASDYAYVPNPKESSTWKLRLTASPGGDPDPHIVGAAAAALSPGGFRGQKVQIPSADLPAVKKKVASAWKKANPDKKPDEMPGSLK